MGLRNRDVEIINPLKKTNVNQHPSCSIDKNSVENDRPEKEKKGIQAKDKLKEKKSSGEIAKRTPEIREKLLILKEKLSAFNLENKISKIKISLPYNEILRNTKYRAQLVKMLKAEDVSISTNMQHLSDSYTIHLQDDKTTILFGPRVEYQDEDKEPPFYISLRVHNMFLHNTMYD